MHQIQKKLLDLAQSKNLATSTLREIGKEIGEEHPQKIKHHISQLLKKGLLKEDKNNKLIVRTSQGLDENNLLISIPILGSANCGQAQIIADEKLEGYLKVSKSVLRYYKPDKIFALQAVGNSMNKANINGDSVEDGDYTIIDSSIKNPSNGSYVLSIIEGLANIKKFVKDEKNKRIILISESTQNYPPIYIHFNDLNDYLINGEIVQVIKRPT